MGKMAAQIWEPDSQRAMAVGSKALLDSISSRSREVPFHPSRTNLISTYGGGFQ